MALSLSYIFVFFCLNVLFLATAFPLVISLCISSVILLFLFFTHSDRYSLILLSVTSLIIIIIIEIILNILPYNPASGCAEDEFKSPGNEYYQENKVVKNFPCGSPDNVRVSGDLTLVDKLLIDFYTDSLGYRNTFDYDNNNYVVIGDSFTVGVTVTQEDILSEKLSKKLNQKVYNASYPTHPAGYHKIWKRLKSKTDNEFKSIFLIFEGNDFFCSIEEVYGGQPPQKKITSYTFDFFQRFETYSFAYGLIGKVKSYYHLSEQPLKINVRKINGQNVGFLDWYENVSKRTEYCNIENWNEVFSFLNEVTNLSLVVFVPTKFRVYSPIFSDRKLPNLQEEFLRNFAYKNDLDYLDLTDELVKKSIELLEYNKFTFGRGDTHWNKEGIEVAAEEIYKKLIN